MGRRPLDQLARRPPTHPRSTAAAAQQRQGPLAPAAQDRLPKVRSNRDGQSILRPSQRGVHVQGGTSNARREGSAWFPPRLPPPRDRPGPDRITPTDHDRRSRRSRIPPCHRPSIKGYGQSMNCNRSCNWDIESLAARWGCPAHRRCSWVRPGPPGRWRPRGRRWRKSGC